ncbi:hypothetical protein UFOVP1290_99 [uncultured Caudovirales phage]|uniref:Uncharacterized protein n=1 Tax=uncultured Caudovirales phage TaxID=2100421 RepID=A0A6J5RHV0_9CAUD|nr:hypothetical protein UFOVP1290_99 [uncultured Caudovirales phage]
MYNVRIAIANSGTKFYFGGSEDHRIVIDPINNTPMYVRGVLHREDGPAIECINSYKEFYLDGIRIKTLEEFDRLVKLKAFW